VAERSFGPVVVRRRLGSELRRLRDRAGLSLEQVARELEVSPSKISRLETGQSPAKVWDVRNLLTLYGVEDEEYRRRAERWVNEGKSQGWWHPYSDASPSDLDQYISLESEAAEINSFCGQLLQGLIQTEEYARTVLSSVLPDLPEDRIEDLVRIRMRRQRILDEPGRALRLGMVIDESVLDRPIGGPDVMAPQLERLVDLSSRIDIRVRPSTAPFHLAMLAPFTVFIPAIHEIDPTVVNVESAFHDAYWYEPEDVAPFVRAFGELQESSLSPDESVALILRKIEESPAGQRGDR
jgi:transcriptional regulator with XRE-family HTH domain